MANVIEAKYKNQAQYEWVELLEPTSQKIIYANLESGEIRWDSPPNVRVRPLANEQWWELFDVNTQRHYYHNVRSGKTEWHRPPTGDVIPLSNLQLIKQFANSESGMEKSSSKTNTKTLDIGVMHRHKLGSSTSGVRNSIHMTPQDHRKMSTPVAATPPIVSRHSGSGVGTTASGSVNRPVSHRRRNSQPSRSGLNAGVGGKQSATSGGGGGSSASFQQRSTSVSGGAGGGIDNALVVTANQRVTEWLRSAGSVPEEADEEEEPIHFTHQKPFPSSTSNQGPQARWSTTRDGVSHTAFQPQPPPLITSTGTRHTSMQQRHHQQQQTPPSSLKINTTPYDRRVVSMVPPPPPPPPLHATVLMPPITTTASQESAFTNLLYDMSCNVVPSQLPQSAGANLISEFSGLSLTPRSVPRTNPHAVAVAGTMPRLSSSSVLSPKPEFSQPPPPPKVPAKMLRNGNGTTVLNASAVISSSPDTEITTNSPSANSESYSGDTESEEREPFSKETTALGAVIQPTMTNNDASLYAKEDIFEQHPFRPAAVMPVDEYTFTVPRQPPSHLQQQQAFFQAQQQCLVADPSAVFNDSASNWMGYHLQMSSQLQPSMQNTEGDQAPPTPPPRLASAMNTMQFTRASRNNFEAAQSSGFLVRNHPFRQPLKQSSYTNPALNTVNCVEDAGMTHTSTRSLLSASSSAHESSLAAVAGSSSIPMTTTTTGSAHSATSTTAVGAVPLHPRRSASGGFIGPADAEAISLSSSLSAAGTASTAGGFRTTGSDSIPPIVAMGTTANSANSTAVACSGSTHFALISGPYTWPKNLLRQGQDFNTVMSWTKAAFSKRLLAATDKGLQKHIPENFKLIQSFMGDRSAKLSKPDLASIIVQRALTTPGVRDELYAQLCKQTTGNYNADSLMRGWELICICLFYFPPNKVFRDPLHAYLTTRSEALSVAISTSDSLSSATNNAGTANGAPAGPLRPGPSLAAAAALAAGSDPTGLVSAPITPAFGVPLATDSGGLDPGASDLNASLATNVAESVISSGAQASEFPYGPWVKLSALHFTRAAPRWFMRSVAVGGVRNPSTPPTKEELLHVKDFLLKPGVFGSSLEEMMKIQSCRFPSLRLPWIQIFLTEELLRLNGAKSEGIFRLVNFIFIVICFEIFSNKDALNLVECCSTDVDLIESVNTEKTHWKVWQSPILG
ncbi:unnamed protein product [Hymenolepis diminuta]|uniref:Rho GTPase-activating protein 39 n=1 Tax=Hymenolepis diminuta TaxID=6216 RepID=A0A158QCX9_HYMDI|nr:unnamed protein product [Hymenolepis diminuta]